MANVLNLDFSKRVDVTCRRGDTMKIDLVVKDSAGTAVDLSTYSSFKMEVRTDDLEDAAYSDGSNAAIILSTEADSADSKHISDTVDTSDTSLISFECSAANMKAIESGLYVYDIQSTNASSEVQTWVHGIFKVNEDVTV